MVKTVISHLVAFSALSLLVAGSLQYNPNSSMVWYFYGRQHCHQYFCPGGGSYPAVQKNRRQDHCGC